MQASGLLRVLCVVWIFSYILEVGHVCQYLLLSSFYGFMFLVLYFLVFYLLVLYFFLLYCCIACYIPEALAGLQGYIHHTWYQLLVLQDFRTIYRLNEQGEGRWDANIQGDKISMKPFVAVVESMWNERIISENFVHRNCLKDWRTFFRNVIQTLAHCSFGTALTNLDITNCTYSSTLELRAVCLSF